MMKIRIATVHHSGFGHTTRLAEAVKEGVEQVAGAAALLLTVEEAQTRWTDLSSAEAIIFGAPTYTAGASAEFKAFEEASTRAVMAKGLGWKDNVATGFTNSGSRSGDKLATLIQLALFAAQHGMLWINLGLPPANHSTKGIGSGTESPWLLAGCGRAIECDQGPISRHPSRILPPHVTSGVASPR